MPQETLGEAETEKLSNKEIGNKEAESLEAKEVTLMGRTVEKIYRRDESKKDNKGEYVGNKLNLICNHPDREDPINLSNATIRKGDKLKSSSLWINTDEDDNIRKNSALALTLNHFGASKVSDLQEGMKIPTEKDESGYLVVKAY